MREAAFFLVCFKSLTLSFIYAYYEAYFDGILITNTYCDLDYIPIQLFHL